jgi:DNA-3-methyladenine glycosylase II
VTSLAEHKPIKIGLTRLLKSDPVFSLLNKKELGVFTRVKREGDFPAMVGAILGQQVSIAAARSMWVKLQGKINGDLTPRKFLKLSDEDLRACGFSRQKVVYARGLAEAILEKTFLPASLADLEDEAVIAEITKLKGFGEWSAHMYLIFSLGRPDVWPVGDLGVVLGAQHYLKKKDRPDLKVMHKLGARFDGHRTAAALLMWDLKAVRDAEARLKKLEV